MPQFLGLSIYPIIVVLVVSYVLVQFCNSLQKRLFGNILPYCLELIILAVRIRIGTKQERKTYLHWDHKIDREELVVLYHP